MPPEFPVRAIHQFHGGSAVGDAITNGLFYTRGLLRELGFKSDIYCADVGSALSRQIRPAAAFPDEPDSLLLVHFSWAIEFDRWLRELRCRKALVYHNITPPEFFEPDSWFDQKARQSRQQLAALRPQMAAACALSRFSASELEALGYGPVDVLPLLIDLEAWADHPCDSDLLQKLQADPAFKLLFVGRLARNKRQNELIEIVAALRERLDRPVRLTLVGGDGARQDYSRELKQLTLDRGLRDEVLYPGKVRQDELLAFYRGSDVFLCLSEHEGFGVPLIEAMANGLPVIAAAGSAVAETVGDGGLLLDDNNPRVVASLLAVLSETPELRRRLQLAGRRRLEGFERRGALRTLARFLKDRLGITPPADVSGCESKLSDPAPHWRLEGPFDSSYSLAIVNRSLADALRKRGASIGLLSTEGGGDFAPDPAFLAAQPMVAQMWRAGQQQRPDVVLRNLYPPRVSGMEAPTQGLAGWGWEESGIPADWAARFNRTLNLITVVSRYVGKVLRDNGVSVPITVVGNGADHLASAAPEPVGVPLGPPDTFRFLHVSSAFPRKGIDALLKAWGQAFSTADNVRLVLKTFANEHNTVRQQLQELAERAPQHAPIELIEHDLRDGQMVTLYRSCDAFVMPSRGEGFGLPVAEAMRHRLPAIVTNHGGLRDFCSHETAWPVDFRFAYTDTHFELFDSVWAEPDVDDLTRAMREVRWATPEQRGRRTETALETVERLFTWDQVAARTQQAVLEIDAAPVLRPLPKTAWITSWNTRCGIAAYAKHLASGFPKGSLRVMANHADEKLEPDEPFVLRCWQQGWDDNLEALFHGVAQGDVKVAVFQFNFGFFEIMAFGRLLDRLRLAGVRCYVIFHATQDVRKPGVEISLSQIRNSLARAEALLVHGVEDLNTLKRFGLVDNVTLFPHGVAEPPFADGRQARAELGLGNDRVMASFGYLLPDKGLPTLIEAFSQLCSTRDEVHLLMVNALYPVPESQDEAARCQELAKRLGVAERVTMITDYLPEARANGLLQAADVIVYPYRSSQESSSAAVRFGLASGRPVACTPLPVFADVARTVHSLPGTSAAEIAAGLRVLLSDGERLASHHALQQRWLADHSWPTLSRRLRAMLTAPPLRDLVSS